jgi:hypothetical protein
MLYKNFNEPKGRAYTLRVETHPEYIPHFMDVLAPLIERAKEIYFIWCDVAYDVPVQMDNVFVMSNDNRRKINMEKGTRYYGEKHQRKTDAYCRIYDKKKQLGEKGIIIDGDLTRIEIGYKPVILLNQVLENPPNHNKDYVTWIITEWDKLDHKL